MKPIGYIYGITKRINLCATLSALSQHYANTHRN
jgi:hypothetical protein